MLCSKCGAELPPTSTFCSACGAPTGSGLDPATVVRRPAIITLLAVLQFIGAAVLLPLGGITVLTSMGSGDPDLVGVVLGGLWLIVGAVNLACGIGLWTLRPYGRALQIGLACIGLLGIPIGTIIAALILYYMWRPGIRALFAGKPYVEYTRAELGEIAQVTQGSQAVTIIIIALVVLGGVAMLGIVAAIAVPGLLRARMSSNESAAIGSMRMIVSAETVYAATAGGGHYATRLSTLAAACPGFSEGFLSPELSQDPSVKSGFTIRLESAGVGAGPNDCNGVPTEQDFYATAVPETFNTTGARAFSTSAAGRIYESRSGIPPSADATLTGTAAPIR
jgi:hypothetical protein